MIEELDKYVAVARISEGTPSAVKQADASLTEMMRRDGLVAGEVDGLVFCQVGGVFGLREVEGFAKRRNW